MATDFSFDQAYGADPLTVLGLLLDPDFVREKAERTGGRDVRVEIHQEDDGRTVLVCVRTLPAEVPAFARSFVGDTITVTETQQWPPTDDGLVTAEVSVDFHAPVGYTGTMAVARTGTGTTVRNAGRFAASVPFVGGKVERLVAEQTQRYLAKEQDLLASHLTPPPRRP